MRISEAPIHSVTVHHHGATIYRRFKLHLEESFPENLEIPGLPLCMQEDSLKVQVLHCEGGSLITGERRAEFFLRPLSEQKEPPKETALRELRRQMKRCEERRDQLLEEIQLFQGIPISPRPSREEGPPSPSPLSARVAFERFSDEMIELRLKELEEREEELKRFQRENAALVQEQAQASSAKSLSAQRLSKVVYLRLFSRGAPTEASLEFSYFVPGARWAPQYQLRLRSEEGEAELILRAVVAQRTGEDWRGVQLRLSTSDPLSYCELPEPSALRIGKRQPQPPPGRGFRPAPKGAARLFEEFDVEAQRLKTAAPQADAFVAPYTPPLELRSLQTPLASLPKAGPSAQLAESEETGKMEQISKEASAPRRRYAAHQAMAPPPRPMAAPPRPPPVAGPSFGGIGGSPQPGGGGASPQAQGIPPFSQLYLPPASEAQRRGRLERIQPGADLGSEALNFAQQARAQAIKVALGILNQPLPNGTLDVAQVTGRFDYAYNAEDPVDVLSDARFHTLNLGNRQAPCHLRYVVVPREEPNVYRIAQLQNPSASPLLPGPADLYVDGEYVLSTQLPTVVPHGKFELGLGVEQAIHCARNTRFEEARSGERVVAMSELRHRIEISLSNHLPRSAECEIRERLPQPAPEAEVVVEETYIDPPWELYDQSERNPVVGGRRWFVQVEPGEQVQLEARYCIRIYANNELLGGNRREA